jgi:1-acyl-sn-glycerol-3-phosphate acyltransferase
MSFISRIMIDQSMRLIARALAAGRLQSIASGVEHIPRAGPALIVARHYHHLYDALALFASLQRPFHVVVTVDWIKNRPTRYFMETIARMARWPVLLRGDSPALGAMKNGAVLSQKDILPYQRKALRESVDLLIEGKVLVIFPEGYPNIDPHYSPKTKLGEFLPFKPGFVSIVGAAETRLNQAIPIIPAGFHYTPGKPWVARLNFGHPIFCKEFNGAREIIPYLEATVRQLSNASDSNGIS